jgi:hypothetical protein
LFIVGLLWSRQSVQWCFTECLGSLESNGQASDNNMFGYWYMWWAYLYLHYVIWLGMKHITLQWIYFVQYMNPHCTICAKRSCSDCVKFWTYHKGDAWLLQYSQIIFKHIVVLCCAWWRQCWLRLEMYARKSTKFMWVTAMSLDVENDARKNTKLYWVMEM